jgi:hypothetical protein
MRSVRKPASIEKAKRARQISILEEELTGGTGVDEGWNNVARGWKDDPKRLVCEISNEAADATRMEITTLLVTEGWKDGATAASRMKITKRLVVDR